MRILITGVTGQLGAALVAALTPFGDVVRADRSYLDLTKPESLHGVLDRVNPSLIVNPAAYTAVDRAEQEPALAFLVNAESPRALGEWAAKAQVPIIHFSTDYVFDGSGNTPWDEDAPQRPLSVYGRSKALGENYLKAAAPPLLIIRTSWLFSAAGRNFLRTIARLACEKDELRIVSDQIGAPTSAAQVAEAVREIVTRRTRDLPAAFFEANGAVHAASDGQTSWHGFGAAICNGLRDRGMRLAVKSVVPIASRDYPTAAMRPLYSKLNTDRIKRVFGVGFGSWQSALNIELNRLVPIIKQSQ